MDHEAILVAGDCHGNTNHVRYLIEAACAAGLTKILQCGDFGAWEHTADGRNFFEDVNRYAARRGVDVYWIDGNHDKISLTLELHPERTEEGFVICGSHLFYIPRGTVWEWSGIRFLAFGGAYSVDKDWRLESEKARHEIWAMREQLMRNQGPDTSAGYFWFPEEEASEEEFTRAMGDKSSIDIMVTHDKPRASNPGWNRKDLEECWPNQDRIQALVRARRPRLLLHGHLHYPYEDEIRCGDDDASTLVKGLDADYAEHPGYKRADSWVIVRLDGIREDTPDRVS